MNPVVIIIYVVFTILMVVSLWKVFTKAKQPGWASLIPFYNGIVLLRIVGKPWWWIILLCIPYVNIIFIIWALNLLAKSFGKSVGFTIGLLLLSFIFFPVLAFGNAEYIRPVGRK